MISILKLLTYYLFLDKTIKNANILSVMDMYELLGKRSPENIRIDLARRFKQCRKNKKITQQELSKRTLISYGTIKRFEQTGYISLDVLIVIASALDMSTDFDLLFNPKKNLSYEELSHGR